MALIKCPECGKEVSSLAASCPNCGCPIKKKLDPSKIHYCPICGMDNQQSSNTVCDWCGNNITMAEAKHGWRYYCEKAKEAHNKKYNFEVTTREEHSILINEEAKYNPEFDEKLAWECFDRWEKRAAEASKRTFERMDAKKQLASKAKCPTCGSTNISKISVASRAISATAFGLFSKTARSQFKCNHCGYKW